MKGKSRMMMRRRSDRTHVCAIMIMLMMFSTYGLGALSIFEDDSVMMPVSSKYTEYDLHDPIMIDGDEAFTEENGVVGGNGTEGEPYIISGWMIDTIDLTAWSAAIEIVNTTEHFLVTNVSIKRENNDNSFRGIYFENITYGAVMACEIDSRYHCIGVQSSYNISIVGNIISGTDVFYGVAISGSDNVTFAENACHRLSVKVGASSNISILDNSVYSFASDERSEGIEVSISYSELCTIKRNTLWAYNVSDMGNGNIILESSTSCTIDDNIMGEGGIGFSGTELWHYSTHQIGTNNTASTLPVIVHMNMDGVRVDDGGTGELIIINCTDVRLQDASFSGDSCHVGIYYGSDIDISDCIFEESETAFRVARAFDVRIRHNTFINTSIIYIDHCNDTDFSDNDLTLCQNSNVMIGSTTNCAFEDNMFGSGSRTAVYLSNSTHFVPKRNHLALGGFRIEGLSIEDFNSHTIDDSNQFANGKPVLYLTDVADREYDISDYGQLIMANCTNVTVHGMITGAEQSIQIGFCRDIVVRESKTYGFAPISLSYADGVTYTENDFVNPGLEMHLIMTHNVTIYHCNFMGNFGMWIVGGFDGYTPTGIRWDNGYPDGGNYYELWSKTDNYSGPGQDILGPDGICDRAYNHHEGVDRYPLMEPFVREQTVGDEGGWDDMILWLSAIGGIVLASSLISYILFLRMGPKKTNDEGRNEPDSD
ncbi:MAG: right-handed parallel beta-helix repeat-containing protein [Candidatus Thermoplasmatota archaeon]|nr:right-handed parallel beta-helix repeat-containing protein [Candidatus Thermoplasmatota archaeon]